MVYYKSVKKEVLLFRFRPDTRGLDNKSYVYRFISFFGYQHI